MSLHDHFEKTSHPAFNRSLDPHSARRQLQVSFGVMAVLAFAIVGSAAAIRPATGFDTKAQGASLAAAAAVSHHNVDARLRSAVSGG